MGSVKGNMKGDWLALMLIESARTQVLSAMVNAAWATGIQRYKTVILRSTWGSKTQCAAVLETH
jgi:hypothetical protein